jgi:hypothetical protein
MLTVPNSRERIKIDALVRNLAWLTTTFSLTITRKALLRVQHPVKCAIFI